MSTTSRRHRPSESLTLQEPPAFATDGRNKIVYRQRRARNGCWASARTPVVGCDLTVVLSRGVLDTIAGATVLKIPGTGLRGERTIYLLRGNSAHSDVVPAVPARARDRRAPRGRLRGPQHRGPPEPVARDRPQPHPERPPPAGSPQSGRARRPRAPPRVGRPAGAALDGPGPLASPRRRGHGRGWLSPPRRHEPESRPRSLPEQIRQARGKRTIATVPPSGGHVRAILPP